MRRASRWLLAVAIIGVALAVHAAVPGASTIAAPYQAIGVGSAAIEDVAVEVHDVTLAESIVVDGATFDTNGVFVVVDATVEVTGDPEMVARELVVGQTVYSIAANDPGDGAGSMPALGFPVRGDTVFEIDGAQLGSLDATIVQLRAMHGSTVSQDLGAQAVVLLRLPDAIEASVNVQALEPVS